MSIFDILSRRIFKPCLPDPAFSLQKRFADHNVKTFACAMVGDHIQFKHYSRSANTWTEDGADTPDTPGVALITTKTLALDTRELPGLNGGNTEESLARAIAERPGGILRDLYEKDRGYHLVPIEGRRAFVFSVKLGDVQRTEAELIKLKHPFVRAVCGLAVATKLALTNLQERYPNAAAVVVSDQNATLTIPVRHGKVEQSVGLAPQLVAMRADDQQSISDVRNLLRRAVRNASELGTSAQVVIVSTPAGAVRTKDTFVSLDYQTEFVTLSPVDLCFA